MSTPPNYSHSLQNHNIGHHYLDTPRSGMPVESGENQLSSDNMPPQLNYNHIQGHNIFTKSNNIKIEKLFEGSSQSHNDIFDPVVQK